MKYFLTIVLLYALAGCTTAGLSPATTQSNASEITHGGNQEPTEFLLSTSAKDFHKSSIGSIHVRDVHLGHVLTPAGAKQYFLCGEFHPTAAGDAAEWIPFTTIKTFGYEQWLGFQASALCQRSSITWHTSGDLSALLQTELDSLR